jgi:hypothetical protein
MGASGSMAVLTRKLQVYSNGALVDAPSRPPIWIHREDKEVFGYIRECATNGNSCPAVFVLREPDLKVELTKEWQFYLAAINYNMVPADVSTELDYRLAFCNSTGLTKPGVPRRDYLKGVNLTAVDERGNPALPKFDKDRTCTRSVMTGSANGDYLIVTTLDGNKPPPLKAGRRYPQTVEEINIDDYLYNPREHRWLFFAANTVSSVSGGTKVYPFPRGATYPWMNDGWKYTWFPHVSRGVIRYPLSRLRRLGEAETIPSPYRTLV